MIPLRRYCRSGLGVSVILTDRFGRYFFAALIPPLFLISSASLDYPWDNRIPISRSLHNEMMV